MPVLERFLRGGYCLQMLRLTKPDCFIRISIGEVVEAMPELCRFYNIVIKMIYCESLHSKIENVPIPRP